MRGILGFPGCGGKRINFQKLTLRIEVLRRPSLPGLFIPAKRNWGNRMNFVPALPAFESQAARAAGA